MPIEKIEDYIEQFQELPFNLSGRVEISGGEPICAGNAKYILTILSLIHKSGGMSVIETNGAWGAADAERKPILKLLSRDAYFTGRPITLNIPVDEFHENISCASNIIAEIVASNYLRGALRIEISGFNTIGSVMANARLRSDLSDKGVQTLKSGNDDLVAYDEYGNGIHLWTDYVSGICKAGRAAANHVYTVDNVQTYVNKIQIDNDDNVVLNYTARDKMNARPLATVVDGLIKQFDIKTR